MTFCFPNGPIPKEVGNLQFIQIAPDGARGIMKKFKWYLILIQLGALVFMPRSYGCTCAAPDITSFYNHTDFAFLGTVENEKIHKNDGYTYTVTVKEIFKCDTCISGDTVIVKGDNMCGTRLTVGETRVIFANRMEEKPGVFFASLCNYLVKNYPSAVDSVRRISTSLIPFQKKSSDDYIYRTSSQYWQRDLNGRERFKWPSFNGGVRIQNDLILPLNE